MDDAVLRVNRLVLFSYNGTGGDEKGVDDWRSNNRAGSVFDDQTHVESVEIDGRSDTTRMRKNRTMVVR